MKIVVGRDPGCDIVISDDPYVSPRHCEIYFSNGAWWVQDLGATNAPRIQRMGLGMPVKVNFKMVLCIGDVLIVGRTELPPWDK